MQLYHFDYAETLSLQQSQNSSFFAVIRGVDWCTDCDYLAAGGSTAGGGDNIRLFKSIKQPETPTNLTAQQSCHRFPTQRDIINTICWGAVTGAVLYKVYADIALSLLLTTITTEPLCYTQHQICNGKLSTYYITAVDADGFESEPASITV